MRAVRLHGPKDIRVDDIAEPRCGSNQVKVAPAYVGICGSDLHEYVSPSFAPVEKPHHVTGDMLPIGFVHEFSGTIVEVGRDAKGDIKVGDRVAVQPTICCWECGACKLGAVNLCDHAGFVGLSGGGGGMSDFVCIDNGFVHKLPDNVPLDVGALVEPLAVAWHAVDNSPIKHGGSALVLGAGPIGLAVIQSLLARGTKTIILSEVAKERQAFAKQFGVHHVLDPSKQDVVRLCKEIVDGMGPDLAFDCAGVAASLKTASLAVRAQGTIINVAIWEGEVLFNPNLLVFGGKTFKAILSYRKPDFKYVIDALTKGAIKPEKMITKRIKMEDVVEEGIKALMKEKNQVKILVEIRY